MTYADKGMTLFSMMNDVSDALILESDIREGAVLSPKPKRAGRFSAFMNHPAMVAVLCAVVSLGVVAAIVLAGRGGPFTPSGGTVEPSTEINTTPYSDMASDGMKIICPRGLSMEWERQITPAYFWAWSEKRSLSVGATYEEWLIDKGEGFTGATEQIAALPSLSDADTFYLSLMKLPYTLLEIKVYDEQMNVVGSGEWSIDQRLTAGKYYISISLMYEKDSYLRVCGDYVFELTLSRTVEGLTFGVIHEEETEPPYEPETNDTNKKPSQVEVHVIATKGDNNHMVPEKYRYWEGYWEGDQEIVGEPMDGFLGRPEEVEGLPSTKGCWFDVILLGDRRLQWVTIYDADMNQIIQDPASSPLKVHLDAGTYYVVLQILWEKASEFGADQYVFAMNLDEPLESLGFNVTHSDRAEIDPPEDSETRDEHETRYEPTESVYACTLVVEQTVYSVEANYIKTTIVAAEPGKTWEGNGMSYRLCRLEGDREIEVYSYSVEPWGESYPTGPDDYATLPLWCNLYAVRRELEEKGETLTPGKYRMYYCADTYLGIESPYVDVELVLPSEITAECEAEAYVCGFAIGGVLVRMEGIGTVLVRDIASEKKWAVGDVLCVKYQQRDLTPNGGTVIDLTQWDEAFTYEWTLSDFVDMTLVSKGTSNE